jgi:hypothetical protein
VIGSCIGEVIFPRMDKGEKDRIGEAKVDDAAPHVVVSGISSVGARVVKEGEVVVVSCGKIAFRNNKFVGSE